MQNQLQEISYWVKNLGHLPIHLIPDKKDKYIMQNGQTGNFCLHFSNDADDEIKYFSQAWSSNTKNFLLLNKKNLILYNWHKEIKKEEIPIANIKNNIEKFYKYIVAQSHKSDEDVIPFILDIFKQFRTLTKEYKNPVNALNLLFSLLAGLEDGDIQKIDRKKWNISDIIIPNNFEFFIDRFKQNLGNIIPDIKLILRHSAGALFQEAQKEIIFFNSQLDLFGTFSGKEITKNLLYSSIHYTPSYLARSIVENSLKLLDIDNLQSIKILDPAMGSSEFLIEILRQLKEKNYKGKIIIQGFDNSETAICTSLFLLNYEKRTIWGDKLTLKIKHVTDSLQESWDKDYTIILMNPPFVSWEQLNKENRESVRISLENNFKGKPNQASAFLFKAIQHLQKGGVIGSVIPSSLFTLDAYQKLRIEIKEIINIELLAKLGNFVFEDALTDVSIIVGKKSINKETVPTIIWTSNEKGVVSNALREFRKMQNNNLVTKDKVNYSIYKPYHFPVISDGWKPISFKEQSLIQNLNLFVANRKLFKIENLFEVIQGVRPGNKKVFVIAKSVFVNLPKSEQKFFVPSIDSEAIDNCTINCENYVWYPYDLSDGKNLIFDEKQLNIKLRDYYKLYLLPNKVELINRKKKIPNWWDLSDRAPRLLPLTTSIISKEFGNSSSFAIDIKGEFVVERGYAWRPKQNFNKSDYYFYLAVFSSTVFDKLLSIFSKQLAGGKWYDLGKNQTKEIPIPNVKEVRNANEYYKLVELGKKLSEGNNNVKPMIDEIVCSFYPAEIN